MVPDVLIQELAPTAERLLERHLATTREWFPHQLVPYDEGRTFADGVAWSEDDSSLDLTPAMRSALFVNLLTEDNLPYYFRDVARLFGGDGPWGEWSRRWTAEEGRHSIVIRDFLTVTRALDPVELERGRMAQVSGGEAPAPGGPHHALIYLTLQELATRISHRNTGVLVGNDTAAYEIMSRVAGDENLHYLFYRDAAAAAIAMEPSEMVLAIEEVVRNFAMPGTGIPNFEAHAAVIARAGIYDLNVHHDQILVPVILRHWKVQDLTGLTSEAEKARESLLARIARTGRIGAKLAERRQASDTVSS
ncbi:MAG: desA [Acidimicrobiia bacterium]|nr:desA [Acidimicrobiia bacterium]